MRTGVFNVVWPLAKKCGQFASIYSLTNVYGSSLSRGASEPVPMSTSFAATILHRISHEWRCSILFHAPADCTLLNFSAAARILINSKSWETADVSSYYKGRVQSEIHSISLESPQNFSFWQWWYTRLLTSRSSSTMQGQLARLRNAYTACVHCFRAISLNWQQGEGLLVMVLCSYFSRSPFYNTTFPVF